MASFNSFIPEVGVYLVKPSSRAFLAASLIWAGVSKSGSPAPKPMTSIPSAFIRFALAVIARVGDELIWLTLFDTDITYHSFTNYRQLFNIPYLTLP